MFLYELISLKLPFDGHEQLKEYVLDGGRPRLTPSVSLFSSFLSLFSPFVFSFNNERSTTLIT